MRPTAWHPLRHLPPVPSNQPAAPPACRGSICRPLLLGLCDPGHAAGCPVGVLRPAARRHRAQPAPLGAAPGGAGAAVARAAPAAGPRRGKASVAAAPPAWRAPVRQAMHPLDGTPCRGRASRPSASRAGLSLQGRPVLPSAACGAAQAGRRVCGAGHGAAGWAQHPVGRDGQVRARCHVPWQVVARPAPRHAPALCLQQLAAHAPRGHSPSSLRRDCSSFPAVAPGLSTRG